MTHRGSILLVDDEEDSRRWAAPSRAGHSVSETTSGPPGQRLLARARSISS
jgi:hypothetical protein